MYTEANSQQCVIFYLFFKQFIPNSAYVYTNNHVCNKMASVNKVNFQKYF